MKPADPAHPPIRQPTPVFRGALGVFVHAARTATVWSSRHGRGLLLAIAAAVFMSLIAPLGSDRLGALVCFVFWLATMATGTAMGLGLIALVKRVGLLEQHPVLQGGLVTLGLWVPQTFVVSAAVAVMFGQPWSWRYGVNASLPVLVICAAMVALNYLADRTPVRTHAQAPGAPPPRFLLRLPPRLREAAIHAVEAQDHYLRVHTGLGQALVLLRLSDAIGELEGVEGAQTHRSWWVARGAIVQVRRGGGRAVLRLTDGVEAPVSRTYARALRAAGWI